MVDQVPHQVPHVQASAQAPVVLRVHPHAAAPAVVVPAVVDKQGKYLQASPLGEAFLSNKQAHSLDKTTDVC